MERDLTGAGVTAATVSAPETESAVSWGAILAGAVGGLAISFVLMTLAVGFGLKLASPWPGGHVDLAGFTPGLGASMIAVQVLSSALGGYLAGRLRSRWTNVHGHETHFRDTAHGFLAWAASTVIGVVLVTMALAPLTERPTPAIAASAASSDSSPADAAALRLRVERDADIAAQFSFFMGIGLLLGAFTSSVAAAIGGLRREDMHTRFWTEQARGGQP